jgi:hypothetical protein
MPVTVRLIVPPEVTRPSAVSMTDDRPYDHVEPKDSGK